MVECIIVNGHRNFIVLYMLSKSHTNCELVKRNAVTLLIASLIIHQTHREMSNFLKREVGKTETLQETNKWNGLGENLLEKSAKMENAI